MIKSQSHPLSRLKAQALAQFAAHPYLKQGFKGLGEALYAPDMIWHGPAPFNDLTGLEAVAAKVWGPMLVAFPDLENRPDIVLSGHFADHDWVTSTGHYVGIFEKPWLGIAPTHRPVWIRYGQFDKYKDDKIIESFVIFDIPGVMMQAGVWPMASELGLSLRSPAPATQDGLSLNERNEEESLKSLDLVSHMIKGLMKYDGQSLSSMGMVRFWTPQFQWYGPSAIGTMRGHKDYERGHQRPFLRAFPDRIGGDHKCRIGDNTYVASTGWPSIRATHAGGGWLGLAPTHKPISMRVMDFWRREGEFLSENWVFIDLIDLFLQMEIDIFERMAELKP
jgi:SnoaL-like polyketide cyclase